MDALLSLLTGGNSIFLALGGGLIAVFVAWMRGRVTGARAERDKQASDRLRARTEADKIDDAIAGRDPQINRQKLREWTPWGKR